MTKPPKALLGLGLGLGLSSPYRVVPLRSLPEVGDQAARNIETWGILSANKRYQYHVTFKLCSASSPSSIISTIPGHRSPNIISSNGRLRPRSQGPDPLRSRHAAEALYDQPQISTTQSWYLICLILLFPRPSSAFHVLDGLLIQ